MMKKVFLSGIGGIGMANVAALLKEGGYDVGGSDANIYEPAASILNRAGIRPLTPYNAENIPTDGTPVIIGNALSRGHVEVEAALDAHVPMYSFPDFLNRFVFAHRSVFTVAGTHGKSTTTACLAHLLDSAGLNPGFLIGAMPLNWPVGARWGGEEAPFILEGDEYDCAFFDKRSKFLHYFPQTLLLGKVEYDHADIFPTLPDMLLSFERLIRIIPRNGVIVYYRDCETTCRLIEKAPCLKISVGLSSLSDWQLLPDSDGLAFRNPEGFRQTVDFSLPGEHNRLNGLMSLAAAHSYAERLNNRFVETLSTFRGLRRRLENLLDTPSLAVYDDFAHHPTAIAAAINAVRENYPHRYLIAVFEPRSNTMVRNIFQKELADSFRRADRVVLGAVHRQNRISPPERLDVARLSDALMKSGIPCNNMTNLEIPEFLKRILPDTESVVLFMSNGGFDGAQLEFVRLIR